MNVLDLQNGAEKGLSIPPTANTSADQMGVGVDLGRGSKIGHVLLAINNLTNPLVIHVQEAPDDVSGDYATTTTFTIGETGDEGTVEVPGNPAAHCLQFTRTNRWARVQAVVGSNTNIRLSAILTSMLSGAGGGVDLYPSA